MEVLSETTRALKFSP